MNKRVVWIICILALAAVGVLLLISKKQPDSRLSAALAYASKVEAALREVDDSYTRQTVTVDNPITYQDASGNTIVYHCLQTIFFEANPDNVTDLHRDAIEGLLEPDILDTFENCTVGNSPAVQGQWKERAYLCWTLAPEFSFVIEYSPESVSEADIFRMAESVGCRNRSPEPE